MRTFDCTRCNEPKFIVTFSQEETWDHARQIDGSASTHVRGEGCFYFKDSGGMYAPPWIRGGTYREELWSGFVEQCRQWGLKHISKVRNKNKGRDKNAISN